MRTNFHLITLCLGLAASLVAAQDRALFIEDSNPVAQRLAARAAGSQPASQPAVRVLRASSANVDAPKAPSEFRQAWHYPPVNQGLTGQCWAFGVTSQLESEMHRLGGQAVKLSEMHTVYWEFVEKARRFIQTHGESGFNRGSEPDAAIAICKQYGVVPATAYSGMAPGRDFYDDRQAVAQMREYLQSLRAAGAWDEERNLAEIRAILDRHFGRPPASFEYAGRTMAPREFLRDVVRLDLDAYVNIVSFTSEPLYQFCEYKVPDNWRHSRHYFNVPLEDFTRLARQAAADGTSFCIGIDDSEPGYLTWENLAFVASFDIPAAQINDDARQMRFNSESTTDDHVVHVVGSCQRNGQQWYLIKDSDTRPRNGPHGGYMFHREDYLRLKTLLLFMPQSTVEQALGRKVQ